MTCAAPAAAQQRVKLPQDAPMRGDSDPAQPPVATVAAGTELVLGATKGGLVAATIEGYLWAASVARGSRGSPHNAQVAAKNGENLRVAPNAPVLAHLPDGFPLDRVTRQGGWIQVRLTGWFDPSAIRSGPAIAARSPDTSAAAGASADPAAGVSLDRAVLARSSQLHRVPDGPPTGTLLPDAPVKVVARSGDWVRVQTEAWMLAADLRPGGGVMVGVSGAEVRSRPQDFEGKLLQWQVQFISVQTADELRRDIPAGRRYVLARGPLPEAGFVYLLVSDAQLREFDRLAPLAEVVVVGRVRVARSQYLGNPIVDLVDMRPVQP